MLESRHRRLGIVTALTLICACDPARKSTPIEDKATPVEDKAVAPATQDAPVPAPVPSPDTEPAPAPPEATPPEPTLSLATLASKSAPADDPSTTAWVHYKAKEFDAAIPYFAQAAIAEPKGWKHPFNIACAAAMAGDDAIARLGLVEALARDREATVVKALRDDDLASIRSKPWFEPTLRGEPVNEPSETTPAPVADAKPLSKAQLDQLAVELVAKHGIRPPIRASLAQTGASGEVLAWVIYTVGKLEQCQTTQSKAACKAKLRGDLDAGDFDETSCADTFLIHASFAPQLTLREPIRLLIPCRITKLRQFEAVDVDADGKLEVVVDVTGQHEGVGMEETMITHAGRNVRILRLDNTEQFELAVDWEVMDIAPGSEQTSRYSLVDRNGDGHPDLRIETREFIGDSVLSFDDAQWLTSDPDDEEAVGDLWTTERLYLPATDAWGPERRVSP